MTPPDALDALARQLIDLILDRHERPQRQRAVRVHLTQKVLPAYYEGISATPRRDLHALLSTLAAQNVLRLQWQKHEVDNWLDWVELVPEQAEVLYQLLGRPARVEMVQALSALLAAQQQATAGWYVGFFTWIQTQIEQSKSVAPFRLAEPDFNRDLLAALYAITQLRAPILERSLSVKLFQDSKHFELLRGTILTILRRHAYYAADYGDDDTALLRAFRVERVPEYIPMAGDITLTTADAALALTSFSPSVALSAATVRQTQSVQTAAAAIVTIENLTTFTEWSALAPRHILTFYTGGFASPSLLHLLILLRRAYPTLPFYHWGDIDGGGFRILAHLRQRLSDVQPLAMSIEWLERHRAYSQPVTPSDVVALLQLQNSLSLGDSDSVIRYLIEHRYKLEQEALDSNEVLQSVLAEIGNTP